MKPSFFSKQTTRQTDIDMLRDAIRLLTIRVSHLESDARENNTPVTAISTDATFQIKQLEGDFFAAQQRQQAFHESVASAISEMGRELSELTLRFAVFQKQFIMMEKQMERLFPHRETTKEDS